MFKNLMNRYYYGKSGQGDYEKEDLPRTRLQLFWEMLRNRAGALMRLNLMYAVVWLPAMFVIFRMVTSIFTLLAAVGSAAIGFGKDYFMSVGLAEGAAVTVAGLLSIFNGLGRIVSGMAFDKLGLRKAQILTSAVAILSPALALLAILLHAGWLGVIGLCLCGFTYGFSPTMSAALVAAFYGNKYFPLNFPVLNLVLIPASFSSTLAGALVTASGSYLSTFVVLTVLSVVGLAVNLSIKKA